MKSEKEIQNKLFHISNMADDGENSQHKELVAQEEILEWVLDLEKKCEHNKKLFTVLVNNSEEV